MPFDAQLLIDILAIPSGVALIGALIALATSKTLPTWFGAGLTAIAWLAGIVVAQYKTLIPWEWWSEECWQRLFWPMGVAALLLGTSSLCCGHANWRLLTMSLVAWATAWLSIPRSSGWRDIDSLEGIWMLAIGISTLLNGWLVERWIATKAPRWGLWVLIGGLGPPLLLAASAYGTMAQWVVSVLAATLGVAIVAFFSPQGLAASIAAPLAVVISAMVAWGRFRSSTPSISWDDLPALFAPGIIALLDTAFAGRIPTWARILLAGLLSAGVIGFLYWRSMDGAAAETW
jgi:hypothetical protein